MVCFAHEAMVRMGIAAVDGFVAAAAADCQRPGGGQPASVLPSKRRSSLHDVAVDVTRRLRHSAISSTFSVPAVEGYRQSRSGGCRICSSLSFFQASNRGRRRCHHSALALHTPHTVTFRSRSSGCHSLHRYFPGLNVSRPGSIAHRIECGIPRTIFSVCVGLTTPGIASAV